MFEWGETAGTKTGTSSPPSPPPPPPSRRPPPPDGTKTGTGPRPPQLQSGDHFLWLAKSRDSVDRRAAIILLLLLCILPFHSTQHLENTSLA